MAFTFDCAIIFSDHPSVLSFTKREKERKEYCFLIPSSHHLCSFDLLQRRFKSASFDEGHGTLCPRRCFVFQL